MVIIGTSHFVSRSHAAHYYANCESSYSDAMVAVADKLANGEIHVGKPALQPGEQLTLIDGGDRYGIISGVTTP